MDYEIQRNIEENGKPKLQLDPVKLLEQHILGVIFLLLLGNAAATFIFFLEILWLQYKK